MDNKFPGAAAFISIEGKEYALFRKGPLKKDKHGNETIPYMIDTSTGQIPYRKQRPLLREYLLLHRVDIEPWEKRTTHWCIQQAIKVAKK